MIIDLQTILSILGVGGVGFGIAYTISKRVLHDVRVIVDDLDDIVASGQIDTGKISEIRDRFKDIFPDKKSKGV